jgi:uncharacterized membrane protein YeaQ/YmgE (transglycosylase-associated protein family)
MMSLIITILAGAFIGWIASMIMKTNAQMGAIANILCGIVGAFIGGLISRVVPIFGSSGSPTFRLGDLVFGIIGACIVIAIYKAVAGGGRTVTR